MNKEKDGSEFCSKAQQNQFLQQKPQTSNYTGNYSQASETTLGIILFLFCAIFFLGKTKVLE